MKWLAVVAACAGCISEPEAPPCAPPHRLDMPSTDRSDFGPYLSTDRLDLYFDNDAVVDGRFDIYRATRTSLSDPFPPGKQISSGFTAFDAFVFGDTIYYGASDGHGGSPIFGAPVGTTITSAANEDIAFPELQSNNLHATLSSDGLTIVYAHNETPTIDSGMDIWMATRTTAGSQFERPHRVSVSTPARDTSPSISGDGQSLVFDTEMFTPGFDRIVTARRDGDDFVDPVQLDLGAPSQFSDASPNYQADGKTIVFITDRDHAASYDLWIYCE